MSYTLVRLYKYRIRVAQQHCPFLIGYGAFILIPNFNSSRSRGSPSRARRSGPKGNKSRPRRRPSARGDRILRAPAAVGRVTGSGLAGRSRVPMMRSSGRNQTITHKEKFYTISPTGAGFETHPFNLNPGLAAMFPWLSDVANRYEKYKFRSVRFIYVPASQAVAGSVSLAFDFDPNDEDPTNAEEATTFHDYVTVSVWGNASLPIDLANGDRLPQKNTRPGLPGADIDLNVYDVGRLHVMTQGCAAGTAGHLEVEYTVELFIHQVQAGIGGTLSSTAGLDATHLIGTNAVSDPHGFLPFTITSDQRITFTQPFDGLVDYIIAGTVLTANFAPVIVGGTLTATNQQVANAGATIVCGGFGIHALTGATLTPTITATTVTSNIMRFAKAPYPAMDFV